MQEERQVSPFEQVINGIMTVSPKDSQAASEVVIARLSTELELQRSKTEQLIKFSQGLYEENQRLYGLLAEKNEPKGDEVELQFKDAIAEVIEGTGDNDE